MIRWLFMMVKHRVNNTGWVWNGDETEGWNEAKPKGNAERFSICIFSIRREVNSWNLHLQKLRGLCKYLANVCNSHSHVYGLHRLLLLTNKAERSTYWGESSFKRAQRYLNINMEKSPYKLNLLHCRQNHNLFMKRKWKGNRKCAADFSLLNLPKGKSLGRSKPATSSYAQAPQHTVWDDFYYIQALLNCLL